MCKNLVQTTTSFAITSLKKITLLKLVIKYILNKNVASLGIILRQPCIFTPIPHSPHTNHEKGLFPCKNLSPFYV